MAMAVDSRQQQPFNTMGYDSMRFAPPQFTNPWVSAPQQSQNQMYATSLPPASGGSDPHRYSTQAPNVSAAYSGAQVSAPSMVTGIVAMDPQLFEQAGLQFNEDGMNATRPYGAQYSTTTTSAGAAYTATAAPQYSADILQRTSPYGYQHHQQQQQHQQQDRRQSHPSVASPTFMGDPIDVLKFRQSSLVNFQDRLHSASEAERQSFSDALDASRGMVAMSQSDITPRNIYGTHPSSRSSSDSYGFPSAHSSHSSISSASTYPSSYYAGSVSDASVGDYSSANESSVESRTLPRPNGLVGGSLPPAPQSMMGQFSSKVSSSSQKKHKCKICDKRFTRPSSLQTHMYSHTGEKPFACDVDGCGRHFSVVSNLRRHRKVHKGEGKDHPSPDDDE